MKPVATYRVQLNREFDFNKLKATLPYLCQLGISHVYASPIVQARHGSTHGYDATDPNKINEELGGKNAFDALCKEAAALGLKWIQDIVPNHIAYSPESTYVSDIMKYGSDSKYHSFLDVDWNHPSPKLKGKIIAPFLNDDYEKCLQNGEIKIAYHDGFQIQYEGLEFPVKISSYNRILQTQNYSSEKEQRKAIDDSLKRFNNDPELLNELLSEQIYTLANWKRALKEINYRRFFDISGLICLRMEENVVFEAFHQLINQLLLEQKVSDLRVDHIDGLYDPEEYLKRLRKLAPEAYIVVEKILLKDENLPTSWPVQGTTGYDFLNQLNGLFVATQNEERLSEIYEKFTGNKQPFDELLYENKKRVILGYFSGDIDNLTRLLGEVLNGRAYGSLPRMREALVELISNFPVYRTYFNGNSERKEDLGFLECALKRSKERNRKIEPEIVAIEKLLGDNSSRDGRHFLMRLQQFTGSIMAKGLEDTTLYVYNRLLSLNEVGGDPSRFGYPLEDFHALQTLRLANWPDSMNATATHDTKRGEDFRARLNILSEIPLEFEEQIAKWSKLNHKTKKTINGKAVPSKNEEYYIYQTLIGSYPFDTAELEGYKKRLNQHLTKALREAKTNSNWLTPNLRYEESASEFVTELLDSVRGNAFLEEFLLFQKEIAFYGFLNSLSQTLIKIACPGVPDFYQGSELWDLNFVDPDNRRPVDFEKRWRFLDEIQSLKPESIQQLLASFGDGRVKIYAINKALEIRNKNRRVFQQGAYIPLTVKGAFKHNIVAFCRRKEAGWAVVVAPRFLVDVARNRQVPLGDVWKDTFVCLPPNAPKAWKDAFTRASVVSKKLGGDEGLWVAELLQSFSVALLLPEESNL